MSNTKPDRSTAVNPETVKVGDRVITQNYHGMALPRSLRRFRTEPTTVTGVATRPSGDGVALVVEGAGGTYGYEWFAPADEPEAPEVQRPTIDFSLDRYQTARAYADIIRSEVGSLLLQTHHTVIEAVYEGEEVDALALIDALVQSLSKAVNRASGRGELAKRIRHLYYIASAVVANQLDGLPAYEDGERSRKIETLQGEVHALRTAGADAIASLERSTAKIHELQTELQEASGRIARSEEIEDSLREKAQRKERLLAAQKQRGHELLEEIRKLKDDVASEKERGDNWVDKVIDLAADLTVERQGRAQDQRERDVYKAAVTFILASLTDEHKQRVHGYIEGYQDGLPES